MTTQSVPLIITGVLARFGMPVLRAHADPMVGIFTPRVEPQGGFGSVVGGLRIDAQGNAAVDLADAEAASLSPREVLTIGAREWVVTSRVPDGSGLTRCELMPADAAGADPMAVYR